ncbi:hypothetical protein LOZ58_001016 [Ophidiomyces ophidiicola]|nr:hypothetical protein LOZ58_001016 [Ophidiomyces ophidiicola]
MPETNAGAAYYQQLALFLYDVWVLYLSCSFAWRCSTKSTLLPFFRANVGHRHIDVGVGTGYLLSQAGGAISSLTLVDLNPNCLSEAVSRIQQGDNRPQEVQCVLANALHRPLLHSTPERSHDSVSLMYLLHTLPGPPENKLQVLRNVKPYLKDNGVVFGATVLGSGVRHNLFGQLLMWFYNKTGIFDNWADGKEDFVRHLAEEFDNVQAHVIGCVLLFTARGPRNAERSR